MQILMKKTLWIAVLLLSIKTTSFAQDPKAKTILDAMSKSFKAMNAFQANFTYTTEGVGVKETAKGDVTVKGTKFRLKLVGQEIYNNGQTVSTFVKENNEVTINNYEPSDNDINPAKIYSIYKKGYKYVFVEEQKQGATVYEVIELTPENKTSQIKNVRISVDKKDKSVKAWKITNKDGKKTVFKVDKFLTNPVGVTDAYFTFDKSKNPSVEVIDLR
jgi:outer membrane lipoprotein-sorting protein